MKMKFHSLNLFIIVLSILYKDENKSYCESTLEWINNYNSRGISDCCVSDSDLFFFLI